MDKDRLALLNIFRESWDKLSEEIEILEFGHMNEADLRCKLYCILSTLLKEYDKDTIFGLVHAEVVLKDSPVDLILFDPIDVDKTFAGIEIKANPKPDGIKEDMKKLKELLDDGLIEIGIFVTMALGDYSLKKRLHELRLLENFHLSYDSSTGHGIVEYGYIQRPDWIKEEAGIQPTIDTLFITMGRDIPEREKLVS